MNEVTDILFKTLHNTGDYGFVNTEVEYRKTTLIPIQQL
jgi:hypothetical protein